MGNPSGKAGSGDGAAEAGDSSVKPECVPRDCLLYPRDPPVLKILRRGNFGTGRKFGTDVAKRYREGSEMLVFLGKRGRKTVQKVKNYGGRKILRIQVPYCF